MRVDLVKNVLPAPFTVLLYVPPLPAIVQDDTADVSSSFFPAMSSGFDKLTFSCSLFLPSPLPCSSFSRSVTINHYHQAVLKR